MIISHRHKFIFIKTEKTAGTSIEVALSKICGPDDIITPISDDDESYRAELGYRGKQNYMLKLKSYSKYDLWRLLMANKRLTFYNHMSGTNVRNLISESTWNSYYKFCFDRNPYDKIISWYYWEGGKEKYPTLLDFIKSGNAGRIKGFDLYTNAGIPIVDKIYKYEELQQSLENISNVLKLEEKLEMPPKRTKGNVRKDKRSYKEILTEEEKEWISKIFAREIAYFDYKF